MPSIGSSKPQDKKSRGDGKSREQKKSKKDAETRPLLESSDESRQSSQSDDKNTTETTLTKLEDLLKKLKTMAREEGDKKSYRDFKIPIDTIKLYDDNKRLDAEAIQWLKDYDNTLRKWIKENPLKKGTDADKAYRAYKDAFGKL